MNRARAYKTAVPILSLLTAAGLLAQLVAGGSLKERSWPVTAYAMFSDNPKEALNFRLHARTRSGRELAVRASDFGLTQKQLKAYLAEWVASRHPGGALKSNARSGLARIAQVWNRGHSSDPAVSLQLTREIYPLPAGPWRSEGVLTWRRS